MKKVIEKLIKDNYKTKTQFAKQIQIKPTDLNRRIAVVCKKIEYLNQFLKNFNLKIIFVKDEIK